VNLRIKRANLADTPTVTQLFREAVLWLASRGLNQWQNMSSVSEHIEKDVAAGVVWVVSSGSESSTVGTLTLDSYADAQFWRPKDDPTNALYVHRLIVSRSRSGRGIGSSMLDWASLKAADGGKRWLRLDAWARNPQLHRYYLNEGFGNLRTLLLDDYMSGALFQRPSGMTVRRGPRIFEVPQVGGKRVSIMAQVPRENL
jgi:GNAT superfamily N-acetyltransferase